MAVIQGASPEAPSADKIVTEGAYYIMDRCASHDDVFPNVLEAFFAGIAELEGQEAEAAVRRDGLAQMHKHFPVEKVLLLQDHVRLALREDLYHWSYRVGHEDLKLDDPFYVDHLIVIRIHYPHPVARKAKTAIEPKPALADTLDHARSALSDPRIVANQISRAIRRPRAKAAFEPAEFHNNLAIPAWAHSAHIDTWYGHSFDGINLWWSIDGVNIDNTVILYPDMIGRPVKYEPEYMYRAPGEPISEPNQVALEAGQLLLFNPEMLHSTQVNVSDETRVALTTRINPGRPKFSDKAPFNFEHWHTSPNLAKKKFAALKVFPAAKNQGVSSFKPRPKFEQTDTHKLTLDTALQAETLTQVCASEELPEGTKLAVNFPNAKLIFWRDGDGGIKAYSRLCPHVGVDLVDGFHDGDKLHCPGHGLSFDWQTGASQCESMKLKAYIAVEEDGQILVRKADSKATEETLEHSAT